jgi:hypothetical protein
MNLFQDKNVHMELYEETYEHDYHQLNNKRNKMLTT